MVVDGEMRMAGFDLVPAKWVGAKRQPRNPAAMRGGGGHAYAPPLPAASVALLAGLLMSITFEARGQCPIPDTCSVPQTARNYPETCLVAEKPIVCWSQLKSGALGTPGVQREASLAIKATDGCGIMLLGNWIDQGFPQNQIAVSWSTDGLAWNPPGDTCGSPSLRRTMTDCYFTSGGTPPIDTECNGVALSCCEYADPLQAPGLIIDPQTWGGSEPWAAVGGNGHFYLANNSVGVVNSGVVFARSNGITPNANDFVVQASNRRVRHLCQFCRPPSERQSIAASPKATRNDVYALSSYIAWPVPQGIAFCKSTDSGNTWTGDLVDCELTRLYDPAQECANDGEHVNFPVGAVNRCGDLSVIWSTVRGSEFKGTLRHRRRSEAGVWSPSIGSFYQPATYILTTPETQPCDVPIPAPSTQPCMPTTYDTWYRQGAPFQSTETGAPAIAIDNSVVNGLPGSRSGRIYVAYPERTSLPESGTTGWIRFVHSCDNGATWSAPQTITTCCRTFSQYPKIAVDTRGTVAICWVDHRYRVLGDGDTCDLFMAWSHDGGDTWRERRISGLLNGNNPNSPCPTELGLSTPFFNAVSANFLNAGVPGEYLGFAADPREGISKFYVLVPGTRADHIASNSDMYAFTIDLRAYGDYDGDFDLDDFDGALIKPGTVCWPDPVATSASVAECSPCAALDMDDDGDLDLDDLGRVYSGAGPMGLPRCDCTGPCGLPPDCTGLGLLGAPESSRLPAALAAAIAPEGCDLAVRYMTHTRRELALELQSSLALLVATRYGAPEIRAIEGFLDCLTVMLERSVVQ